MSVMACEMGTALPGSCGGWRACHVGGTAQAKAQGHGNLAE